MHKKSIQLFILCILTLALVNCERATTDKSKVSLQLPTYQKDSLLSSCTKCLKVIGVNVDGTGFPTIVNFQKMARIEEIGTELNSEIDLEVPSGPQRKIQVLAIYQLADKTLEIQYGSVVADLLSAEPPPITMSLSNLGPFKGGSIVGRYLDLIGTNPGPTGRVIISINHAASGMKMDILSAEMLNGWFDFFASENFPMSYRIILREQLTSTTGSTLPDSDIPLTGVLLSGVPIPGFQNIVLDSLMPLTGGTLKNHLARVHRPASYWESKDNFVSSKFVNEAHDIVYGYFGSTSATALKIVCAPYVTLGPATTLLTKVAIDSIGASKLTYYFNQDFPADIYHIGGGNQLTYPAICGTSSMNANRFELNRISINKDQFDGNGNDTATSMAGAFTYVSYSGVISKYIATGTTPRYYTFQFMPELFPPSGSLFDGAKIFKKSNAVNGGYDYVRCDPLWLGANGFGEDTGPSVNYLSSFEQVVFSFLGGMPNPADGFIICPTKAGNLTGFGGFYVGLLN